MESVHLSLPTRAREKYFYKTDFFELFLLFKDLLVNFSNNDS
jgi:hypothetical protein